MIRVGFDDQIFRMQVVGGVSRYFAELIPRLPDFGIEPVLTFRRTTNRHLAQSGLASLRQRSMLADRIERGIWRKYGLPGAGAMKHRQVDLVHHTYFHPAYQRRAQGPSVVTVYDMISELLPDQPGAQNQRKWKSGACAAADQIVAISQSTADDLRRVYGETIADRVTVVPLGVGDQFFQPGPAVPGLPVEYLLFVGVRRGYKDFPVALDAFARVAQKHQGLHLVVCGGGPFKPSEVESIARHRLTGRVLRIEASDAEMPTIYRGARAFVFPSSYEGFGLPTLESLAAGTPTVLADTACSREVGGDAVSYFRTGDSGDLARAIQLALTASIREAATKAGPARAQLFSWDRTASLTADVYQSLFEQIQSKKLRSESGSTAIG